MLWRDFMVFREGRVVRLRDFFSLTDCFGCFEDASVKARNAIVFIWRILLKGLKGPIGSLRR